MLGVILSFFFASASFGEAIYGVVVKVADGDTISIVGDDGIKQRIRLLHIDAPEKKQSESSETFEVLAEKILDKTVRVEYEKKDLYGRILGDVYLDERWINQEMVSEGLAWQNRLYSDQLQNEEKKARSMRRGIWKLDPHPLPPWIFRIDRRIKQLQARRKRLMAELNQ